MRPDEIISHKYREEAWELSPGALNIEEPGGKVRKNQQGDRRSSLWGSRKAGVVSHLLTDPSQERQVRKRVTTKDWTQMALDSNLSHMLSTKVVNTSYMPLGPSVESRGRLLSNRWLHAGPL